MKILASQDFIIGGPAKKGVVIESQCATSRSLLDQVVVLHYIGPSTAFVMPDRSCNQISAIWPQSNP